ncbi:MAG: chemotaxis protein CheD [Candidatus Hydrogenedentes bacterium]|nr:chemotaxis protein CheD [Candidatus Hydrogenedentota bacterium]
MSKELEKLPEFFLEPGYIYFSKSPLNLYAVLGSCVAVCIWDKNLKIGGMCHFLYPRVPSKEKRTSKYGDVAVLGLIKMMENSGAKRESMLAQIVGGASPPFIKNDNNSLGKENAEVARSILNKKGITIASEDTGGSMGRKIVFNTYTGHLMVLKVYKIRKDDWILHSTE